MSKRLVALLLTCFTLFVSPVYAAISVVQSCGNGGNDAVCTFGAGWTGGNTIFIVSNYQGQTAGQLSITGTSNSPSSFGEINAGSTNRMYGFCLVVSGGDIGRTSFTATTVGGGVAYTAAVEVSGADACNEDGTEVALVSADGTSPYNLTTPLTTTVPGSIIMGVVKSTSTSDYNGVTGGACVPSSCADFPGGDNVGVALGGYRITGAAGNQDLEFTSAAGETTSYGAFALKAAVAGGSTCQGALGLLGVGC